MDNYKIIICLGETIDYILLEDTTKERAISIAKEVFISRIGVDKVIVIENNDKELYTIEL